MKKAIVIGGTSGIGRGLAEILVKNGFNVGITGRRTELLEELRAQNPESFIISKFDINDIKNNNDNLDKLVVDLGGLDMLIISSGIGDININLDYKIEKQTIDINVTGFTSVVNWAFHFFENQKFGHLIAITSVGGLRGSGYAPAYNATKAFQINYLEGLRQKVTKLNYPIFITDIRPGFVDTAMAKGDGLFWIASVEKATKQIFEAIEKRKKLVYISKRWRLIAIILKIIPKQIYERM